ncbi:MAG: AAA family ATPase [Clavibacter sp.]|nr:AAA family ATPase [Clavibacter sp.]
MSFDFSDGRTIIRGTNEAGKSTLCNAFFWLLMGVDAQDRTNYELYDTTLDFTPENAIPAVVDGTFDIDGIEYSFKRVAKQKWVRPRGKLEYVKDKSDEYTFYIDGLAVSANVYKERVESLLAPTDKLKLMLNVRYYQTLDWKKLRKHFSDMVGMIDKSELKGNYAIIEPMIEKFEKDETFKGNAVEAVKEKLRQEINPKKESAKTLETEIKGMKTMLPSLDGVEEAEKEREKKLARISKIDKEILGLGEANKPFVEKRNAELKAIDEKKRELDKASIDWNNEQHAKVIELSDKINEIDLQNDKIRKNNELVESQRRSLIQQRDIAHENYLHYKAERDRLHAEKEALDASVFDENQVCQSCGQPLPYDKVAEIRTKVYDERSKRRAIIVENGVRAKNERDRQEELEKSITKQIEELPESQPLLSIDELESQLALAKTNIVPFEKSDIYATLTKEIADMEANLTVVPEIDSAELIAEKNRLNDGIVDLLIICGKRVERENGLKRIESKEKEQSEVGVELARLEGLFDKCVEREREWAFIVRDRANKYLHYSHVEMTELTKAGELVDVCTLTARSVGSGSQNNATQILIGVDLAQAFQANAGLNLPIFIDNAEGIVDSNLPDCDNQMVLLYVDEKYKTLTIC